MIEMKIKLAVEIDKIETSHDADCGGYVNYTAIVALTDHQGFARFGEPKKIRHTLYFDDTLGVHRATDWQDFGAFNSDADAAYGVFAEYLRDDLLDAIHTAAAEAVRGELAEAGAAGEGTV